MSEKGTREHRCKGIKNDEGHSGTIYSANIGTSNANSCTSSQINCRSTIDDISTWEMAEGANARGTTYDTPHERQPREKRQKVPQTTSP
jgi:hypothetical protein